MGYDRKTSKMWVVEPGKVVMPKQEPSIYQDSLDFHSTHSHSHCYYSHSACSVHDWQSLVGIYRQKRDMGYVEHGVESSWKTSSRFDFGLAIEIEQEPFGFAVVVMVPRIHHLIDQRASREQP